MAMLPTSCRISRCSRVASHNVSSHNPICLYRSALVFQMVKDLPALQKTQVRSLGREDPLEKGMATHSSIPACEFHGQRSLVGFSPYRVVEFDTTEATTHTHTQLDHTACEVWVVYRITSHLKNLSWDSLFCCLILLCFWCCRNLTPWLEREEPS